MLEPYDSEQGFSDKTLQCRGCGQDFLFSASQQKFFMYKGYLKPPSRCSECQRKATEGFQDMTIRCKECREEFIFSANRQAWFRARGLKNIPTRCKECQQRALAGYEDKVCGFCVLMHVPVSVCVHVHGGT